MVPPRVPPQTGGTALYAILRLRWIRLYSAFLTWLSLSALSVRCRQKVGHETDQHFQSKRARRITALRKGLDVDGSHEGSVLQGPNALEEYEQASAAAREAEEDIIASLPLGRAWESPQLQSPPRPSSPQAWQSAQGERTDGFPPVAAVRAPSVSSSNAIVQHVLTALERAQGLAQLLDDEEPAPETEGQAGTELSFECKDLCNLDVGSLSDPCCVVYARLDSNQGYEEVGRTEMLRNTLSPRWKKKVTLPHTPQCLIHLRLRVYDVDNDTATLDDDDHLGSVDFPLDEIVRRRLSVGAIHFKLTGPPMSAHRHWGAMIVRAHKSRSSKGPLAVEADPKPVPASISTSMDCHICVGTSPLFECSDNVK